MYKKNESSSEGFSLRKNLKKLYSSVINRKKKWNFIFFNSQSHFLKLVKLFFS